MLEGEKMRKEKLQMLFNVLGLMGACIYALSILGIGKLNQSIWIMFVSSLFIGYRIKDLKINTQYKMLIIFIILLPIFEHFSAKTFEDKMTLNILRESYKFFPIFMIPLFTNSIKKIELVCSMVGITVLINCMTIYKVCKENNFNFIGTYDGRFSLSYTSHCMAMLSFLILGLLLYSIKNNQKKIAIYSMINYIICIYFVILGQRRGAYLAIIIPIGVILILFLDKKKFLIFSLCLGIGIASITRLPIIKQNIYYKRFVSIKDVKEASPAIRLILWDASIKIFKENPIFGVGEDGGTKYYLEYIENNKEELNKRLNNSLESLVAVAKKSNPHNVYFKKIVDLGSLGIYLFFVLGYIGINQIRIFFKLKNNKSDILYIFIGIIGSYLSFFIMGLTEDVWGTYVIKNSLFLTLGLYFSFYSILKKDKILQK